MEENPTLALFTFRGSKAEVRKRKRSTKRPLPEPYSAEDVLAHDIKDLLGEQYVKEVLEKEDESGWTPPAALKRGEAITLRVSAFTVSGELLEALSELMRLRRVIVRVSRGRLVHQVDCGDPFCSSWRSHQMCHLQA